MITVVVAVQHVTSTRAASQSVCELITKVCYITLILCFHGNRAMKMLSHAEGIDLERELHRIFKMFLSSQTTLMKLKGMLYHMTCRTNHMTYTVLT